MNTYTDGYQFRVEVKWNREFHFVPCGTKRFATQHDAIMYARDLANMGDGARVKGVRVLRDDDDTVVWFG